MAPLLVTFGLLLAFVGLVLWVQHLDRVKARREMERGLTIDLSHLHYRPLLEAAKEFDRIHFDWPASNGAASRDDLSGVDDRDEMPWRPAREDDPYEQMREGLS